MGTYWKIVYAVWLGFCLLVFLISYFAAHNSTFLGSFFLAFLLAIMPYLYFLCLFKIPVDFLCYCDKVKRDINDFALFFKQYKWYFTIPIIGFL